LCLSHLGLTYPQDPRRIELIERQYLNTGVVIIDDLLSAEALTELQQGCFASTSWHGVKPTYVASLFETGFASPLLAQVAEELTAALPAIFQTSAPGMESSSGSGSGNSSGSSSGSGSGSGSSSGSGSGREGRKARHYLPLQNQWAFKYGVGQTLPGVQIHADPSGVNVNLWITVSSAVGE
jgi:hypothetical protein